MKDEVKNQVSSMFMNVVKNVLLASILPLVGIAVTLYSNVHYLIKENEKKDQRIQVLDQKVLKLSQVVLVMNTTMKLYHASQTSAAEPKNKILMRIQKRQARRKKLELLLKQVKKSLAEQKESRKAPQKKP